MRHRLSIGLIAMAVCLGLASPTLGRHGKKQPDLPFKRWTYQTPEQQHALNNAVKNRIAWRSGQLVNSDPITEVDAMLANKTRRPLVIPLGPLGSKKPIVLEASPHESVYGQDRQVKAYTGVRTTFLLPGAYAHLVAKHVQLFESIEPNLFYTPETFGDNSTRMAFAYIGIANRARSPRFYTTRIDLKLNPDGSGSISSADDDKIAMLNKLVAGSSVQKVDEYVKEVGFSKDQMDKALEVLNQDWQESIQYARRVLPTK